METDIPQIKKSNFENAIFVADENENDRVLLRKAFESLNLKFDLKFAENGDKLLKDLEDFYAKSTSCPRMILLDLNIKKPDGLTTLKMIKSHFLYKTIPVLILSSKESHRSVVEAYDLGANSFIIKPASLDQFIDFVKTLNSYWFNYAKLPVDIK